MRLWSLHPRYLDAKGLVALWREGLLALAVLEGRTRGYRHHPQLQRFRNTPRPATAVRSYLWHVYDEAVRRHYRFDRSRLGRRPASPPALTVARGQLRYELAHLERKLRMRDAERGRSLARLGNPRPHPLFAVVPGGVESWERTKALPGRPSDTILSLSSRGGSDGTGR